MIDFEAARKNPTNYFQHPDNILENQELTREQKIAILHQWEYDQRELEVAAEENMMGSEEDLLDSILRALRRLDAGVDPELSGQPTKHGGREE